MLFRLTSRSMTLDDLEFPENFARFRRFERQQHAKRMNILKESIDPYFQRQRCNP